MMYDLHQFGSCFFFVKQKTAYEMRISDWSSDVCSSDLRLHQRAQNEIVVPLKPLTVGVLSPPRAIERIGHPKCVGVIVVSDEAVFDDGAQDVDPLSPCQPAPIEESLSDSLRDEAELRVEGVVVNNELKRGRVLDTEPSPKQPDKIGRAHV